MLEDADVPVTVLLGGADGPVTVLLGGTDGPVLVLLEGADVAVTVLGGTPFSSKKIIFANHYVISSVIQEEIFKCVPVRKGRGSWRAADVTIMLRALSISR